MIVSFFFCINMVNFFNAYVPWMNSTPYPLLPNKLTQNIMVETTSVSSQFLGIRYLGMTYMASVLQTLSQATAWCCSGLWSHMYARFGKDLLLGPCGCWQNFGPGRLLDTRLFRWLSWFLATFGPSIEYFTILQLVSSEWANKRARERSSKIKVRVFNS